MGRLARCPDCNHPVEDHDLWGCTLMSCHAACSLSGEFLREYFEEGGA